MKDSCCLLPNPICYVSLGRLGDQMVILPGLWHLAKETGRKPVVIVSREFASVYDGVSYVTCDTVALSWWREVTLARKYAVSKYGHCIIPKFWDDPELEPPTPQPGAKLTQLTFQGRKIVLAADDWTSYQTSQWEGAGFDRSQMLDWPLVFDRRSPPREESLRRQWFRTPKPKLLVAIGGGATSPFPAVPEITLLIQKFARDFEIINLSKIQATRIYDFLGLYDRAAGLIVSDSAPAHLAAASKVPTIWFINNGGAGSVPRGNVAAAIRYANVMQERSRVAEIIESWCVKPEEPPLAPVRDGGGGNMAMALA